MSKKRKNTKKINFIDEVKRFSCHDGYTVGDIIIYTRYSDKKVSVGEIRWFCMTSEGMAGTIIDQNLGNFQLGLCSSFEENPSDYRIKSLVSRKKEKKVK